MKKLIVILLVFLGGNVLGQFSYKPLALDMYRVPDSLVVNANGDTVKYKAPRLSPAQRHPSKNGKPHSPHKATIMAMCLPGSGQVYNRQYWKLPILYGGVAAAIYGVSWNNKRFQEYMDAYLDISLYANALKADPNTPYPAAHAWEKIPLRGRLTWKEYFEQYPSVVSRFQTVFENRRTGFKRNRDLCYIVTAGVYVVNILDACVFAHFYDFEIDDNLSMSVKPSYNFSPVNGGNMGLTFALTF